MPTKKQLQWYEERFHYALAMLVLDRRQQAKEKVAEVLVRLEKNLTAEEE